MNRGRMTSDIRPSADVSRRRRPVVLIRRVLIRRSAVLHARPAAEQLLEERHRARLYRATLARACDFLRPVLRRLDHRPLAPDRGQRTAVEVVDVAADLQLAVVEERGLI